MTKFVSPAAAAELLRTGATLVDIREPTEHRRERIEGATNCPVSDLDAIEIDGEMLIFHCHSGARTQAHMSQLGAKAAGRAWLVLDGGLQTWKSSGLPVTRDHSQPIALQRQVMIVAGSLVLLGVLLATFVAEPLMWLSGFVGAGLVFAGVTGFCGMANILLLAPWNRRAASN